MLSVAVEQVENSIHQVESALSEINEKVSTRLQIPQDSGLTAASLIERVSR